MVRKRRVSQELRQKLYRQMSELYESDEAAFAERLQVAIRVLPAESSRNHFNTLIRQLWTEGAREASVDEWERTLVKRWSKLLGRIGTLPEHFEVEGDLDDPMLESLATTLIGALDYQRTLDDWRGGEDV